MSQDNSINGPLKELYKTQVITRKFGFDGNIYWFTNDVTYVIIKEKNRIIIRVNLLN